MGVVVSPADALTPTIKSVTHDLLSTPAANATTHTVPYLATGWLPGGFQI